MVLINDNIANRKPYGIVQFFESFKQSRRLLKYRSPKKVKRMGNSALNVPAVADTGLYYESLYCI